MAFSLDDKELEEIISILKESDLYAELTPEERDSLVRIILSS
jgi:hypothetical protein